MTLKMRTRRGLAMAGFVPVALAVAACGSAASSTNSAPATATDASAAVSHATVSITQGHLVGANGHALYLWAADAKDESHCSSSCLAVWPAVTASGKPTAGAGVTAGQLGTITTDGARQVTYDGHPLYRFVEDKNATSTAGQGSDSFGARWWLVAPSGKAITAATSSAPATTSTTSSASASGSSSGSGW